MSTGNDPVGTIPAMPAAGPLLGPELIEVVQDGVSKKALLSDVITSGKSAFDLAVDEGFTGTLAEWLESNKGKSVYQEAVDGGFTGTIDDYLASLKGVDGTSVRILGTLPDVGSLPTPATAKMGDSYIVGDYLYTLNGPNWFNAGKIRGDSAYAVAVSNGETGTEVEWLAKLKGDKGAAGTVKVLGTLDNLAELNQIPTEGLSDGDSYFAEGQLWVWNMTAWIGSGSLLGPRGITLLGTWPENFELPDVSSSAVGDAYMWKQDIWVLVPGFDGTPLPPGEDPPLPVWVNIGLEGPQGDSAYAVAVSAGFVGTKPQWLASLVGKSAFQIWKDLGHAGDEQAFIDSLQSVQPGPIGPPGPARAPFFVKGSKPSEGALPTPGNETEAWYVGSNLYVWVETQSQYVDLGSVGGLSAYELAVTQGFGGTLQQWLDSLKSIVPGPIGPRGQNLNVKGTVPNVASLGNIQGVVEQDAYSIADTGDLWVFVDAAWKNIGPFRGKSVYQIWIDNGHSGDEATYLASLQGRDGTNGTNIVVKGSVATFTALTTTPAEQDVFSVRDTNTLYAYVGGGWIPLGSFKGADGVDGQPGANGSSITVIKVLTPEDPAVPDAAANAGKAYVDLNGHIQLSILGTWFDAGAVGATGDRGPQGHGVNLRGTVAGPTYLPRPDQGAVDGDGYFTATDKMLYVMTDGQWEGPFDIIGPEGPPGKDGEKGEAGKSINILGDYPTLAALSAAHPTGTLGDGYLVGNNLAIWTTADGGGWIDIGLVRGPQGVQGVQGPPGIGKKGDKGDKGSAWITLPAGVDEPGAGFTGNIGDWAVSDTFKVYYKSATSGWVYWGRLVAGDVNSPLLSFGKAVRLGNEWIVLPVDEAPNMIDGKLYVRRLIAGNTENEGEWIALQFPVSEAPKDGKQYIRKDGSWAEVVIPAAGIPEAPNDAKAYGRKGLAWTAVLEDAPSDANYYVRHGGAWAFAPTGLGDAPNDTNGYMRKAGAWAIVPSPGLADAPNDTKAYGRKGAAWTAVLEEAPNDANGYMRKGGSWSIVPAAGIGDAPNDTNSYVRKGNTWTIMPSGGIADAPADNGYYTRRNAAWVAAPTYLADAPNDTNFYARKAGAWTTFSPGLADAANDGTLYARKNGGWVAVPTAGLSDAPSDANTYGRKGAAWVILPTPGIADAPSDATFYGRKGGAWSTFTPFTEAPTDGLQYLRKNSAWVSLDVYNLKINAAAAGVLDLAIGNVFTVANSSATTISFKAGTVPASTRTMTVVLVINGSATITWPTIVWNGSSAPTLGTTTTIVTLLWDGTRWIGTVGATI